MTPQHPQTTSLPVTFNMAIIDQPGSTDGRKFLQFEIQVPMASFAVILEPNAFRQMLPDFFRQASKACNDAIDQSGVGGIVVANAQTLDVLKGNEHGN